MPHTSTSTCTLHTAIMVHSHTHTKCCCSRKDLSNFLSDICIACTSGDQIFNWKHKSHIENRVGRERVEPKLKHENRRVFTPCVLCWSAIVLECKRHEISQANVSLFVFFSSSSIMTDAFAVNSKGKEIERERIETLPTNTM